MGVWDIVVFATTALVVILAIAGGVEVLRRLRGQRRLIEELERARSGLIEDPAELTDGDEPVPLP